MGEPGLKDRIEAVIAAYLGRKTAESAVRISATAWLSIPPEQLAPEHRVRFCDGLRPMLRTLLGAEVSGLVVARVEEEMRR